MVKEEDIYYTIEDVVRSEIKVKGSRFIATAAPVKNTEEAKLFLEKIRSEFYDATHNCFAWRLGHGGMDFRAADDGEPSGSAGKPILFSIKKFDLTDIIVVVTRFFGGTKLGVGGLARAYSDSAVETLSQVKKKGIHLTTKVRVLCTYEDLSVVKRIVDQFAYKFEETYTDSIEIISQIHNSDVEDFCNQINDRTHARAGAIILKD